MQSELKKKDGEEEVTLPKLDDMMIETIDERSTDNMVTRNSVYNSIPVS